MCVTIDGVWITDSIYWPSRWRTRFCNCQAGGYRTPTPQSSLHRLTTD
jgi:hypothetical protein